MDTAVFVQHRMIYGSGTVFGGMGTVWENPTRRLPVLNTSYTHPLMCL